MSLIICKECNKEISDKAISCPHCGCPTIEKPKRPKYVRMRRGFGITNLVIGLLMLTMIISSKGGIDGNKLQMGASWFLIVTGFISMLGAKKKPAVITSIVFYSLSIMYFIGIMLEIEGFSTLAVMDIVFVTLVSISLSCKESFS